MSLARFNLFVNSYQFLAFKAKPGFYRNLECAGVVFFWLWFGGGILRSIPDSTTRLGFIVLCFVVTSPLHVQVSIWIYRIPSSPTHPISSDRTVALCAVNRRSRYLRIFPGSTAQDDYGRYLPGVHGMDPRWPEHAGNAPRRLLCGASHRATLTMRYQLFPRIPRHNLRKATKFVQEWAEEQGVQYQTYHFIEGNRRVLSVLRDVANQVDIMGKVAAAQARGDLHRH